MRHNSGRLSAGNDDARTPADVRRAVWLPFATAVLVFATSQTACFFRKGKVAEPQARPPARIVLLPMNVPTENPDLRWLALAVPVLIAQAIEDSSELEVVPLWESMPVVKESLGESRTIAPENAEYIGSRLTARWATQGEITADTEGISILLDFIPSRPTLVPFRYQNNGPVSSLGNHVNEAMEQFLRYLVAPEREWKKLDPNAIRTVADAIDREYGWFVDAQPGRNESVVAGFAKTHGRAAGLLFNPNLYPGLETRPAGGAPPPQNKPAATPVPAVPPPPAGSPPSGSPPEERSHVDPAAAPQAASDSTAAAQEPSEVRPPESIIQRSNSPPAQGGSAPELSTPVPAPAPAEPPAEPASPPSMSETRQPSALAVDAGCKIQVFSSRSRAQAEAFSERLARAGLQPRVRQADLKAKGIWYRVQLQGYSSHRAATAAADKLRADALIEDYWILR